MKSLTHGIKLSTWALALTTLAFTQTAVLADEHVVYYAVESYVGPAEEGWQEEARRCLERYETEISRLEGTFVILSQPFTVRSFKPNGDFDEWRAGVRFLVRGLKRDKYNPLFRNAAVFGPHDPLLVTLRERETPTAMRGVRFSMQEVHRLATFRPGSRTHKVDGALLQHAWKQLLGGRPDDLERFSPVVSVVVPHGWRMTAERAPSAALLTEFSWRFQFDVERINTILGRTHLDRPLYSLSPSELKVFETAFYRMVSLPADSEQRTKSWRLRGASLPLKQYDELLYLRLLASTCNEHTAKVRESSSAEGKRGLLQRIRGRVLQKLLQK